LPPPYALDNMDVLGFWLTGDSQKIQALLDSTLNIGAQTRYLDLTSLITQAINFPGLAGLLRTDYPILMTLHNIGQLYSTAHLGAESLQDRGFFAYQEAILWIPIIAWDNMTLANLVAGHPPPMYLYNPLILADEPLAVAGGREIFGLQ